MKYALLILLAAALLGLLAGQLRDGFECAFHGVRCCL